MEEQLENQKENPQENIQTIEIVELSEEKQQELNNQIDQKITPSQLNRMISSFYAKNKVVKIEPIDNNKKRKKKRREQKAARRLNR
jgi:hypothetical protein